MNKMAKVALTGITLFYLLFIVVLGMAVSKTAQAGEYRSPKQVKLFKRYNPCPDTGLSFNCPHFRVDHWVALDVGGEDNFATNMVWQQYSVSKFKDGQERKANWRELLAEYPPCPVDSTKYSKCPGFVQVWEKPLECGGAKAAYNIVWRTPVEIVRNESKGCAVAN